MNGIVVKDLESDDPKVLVAEVMDHVGEDKGMG
jgi:hypothetical protein